MESRAHHSPPPKPPRRWLPSGNSAPKGMRPRRNRSSTSANGLGRTCEFLVHTWRGKWPPRPPTPPRRWTPSANSAPKACGHSGITTAPACKAWAAPANPQCIFCVVTAGIPPAPPVGFQRYMVYRWLTKHLYPITLNPSIHSVSSTGSPSDAPNQWQV